MREADGVGRRRFRVVLTVLSLFLGVLWLVYLVDHHWVEGGLYWLGLYPRSAHGLVGFIFSPLLHSDFSHLANNSLGLLTIGLMLFYFYPYDAVRVVVSGWLCSCSVIWLIGSPSYHIGASGLVYAMAFYVVARGLRLRQRALSAVALLLIFLYGSLFWGIFPSASPEISWEGHLGGALAGLVCAFAIPRPGIGGEDEGIEVGVYPRFRVNHTGPLGARVSWRIGEKKG